MTRRLFRISVLGLLILGLLGPRASLADDQSEFRPTIVFASTRDMPTSPIAVALEIYAINPDGSFPCSASSCHPQRLTNNDDGEGFPVVSTDGKKIVFDSNRQRATGEPVNTSDLFVMKTDGTDQQFLTRGSSASWSPDSRRIAFHASASGTGLPIRDDPGAATADSDIFVINVGDCLDDVVACQDVNGPVKRNLTMNLEANGTDRTADAIDDDPTWSPDGQKIAFASHPASDDRNNSLHAEIYVMNADGTSLTQLTANTEEERAPAWSPDGERIAFMCRPEQLGGIGPFEICLMDADGHNRIQVTHDSTATSSIFHGTVGWSPDGTMIAFTKNVLSRPLTRELWMMPPVVDAQQTQLTDTPGINHESNWGVVRFPGKGHGQNAAGDNHRSADTPRSPAVDDGKGHDGTAHHGKHHHDKKHKQAKPHTGGGKRHR